MLCVLVFLSSESSSSASKTRFDSKHTASGTACGWINPMSTAIGLLCPFCSIRWKKAFIISRAIGERSQRDHKIPRTKCQSVGSREPIQAQEMVVNCLQHFQGTHHQDHNLHFFCQRSIRRTDRCPRRVASMNFSSGMLVR